MDLAFFVRGNPALSNFGNLPGHNRHCGPSPQRR